MPNKPREPPPPPTPMPTPPSIGADKNKDFLKWIRSMPRELRKDQLQRIVSGGVLRGTSAKAALFKLQQRCAVLLWRLDPVRGLNDYAANHCAQISPAALRHKPCPLSRRQEIHAGQQQRRQQRKRRRSSESQVILEAATAVTPKKPKEVINSAIPEKDSAHSAPTVQPECAVVTSLRSDEPSEKSPTKPLGIPRSVIQSPQHSLQPPQPSTSQPDLQPSRSSTAPAQPSSKSTQLSAQTCPSSTQPPRPTVVTIVVRETQLCAQPPQPPAQPPQPSAQPPQPSGQPPRPSQPPQPSAQPPRPSAHPPQPSAQPPLPSAQRPRPSPQPLQPSAQPLQPSHQPPRPSPQPPQPSAQPPQHSTQPLQPSTQPPQHSTQHLQPSTQPPQHSTQPLQPSTQPPQPCAVVSKVVGRNEPSAQPSLLLSERVVDAALHDIARTIHGAEKELANIDGKLKSFLEIPTTQRLERMQQALLESSAILSTKAATLKACVDRGVVTFLCGSFYPSLLRKVHKVESLKLYSNMRLMTMVNMLLSIAQPNSDPVYVLNAFVAQTLSKQVARKNPGAQPAPSSTVAHTPAVNYVSVDAGASQSGYIYLANAQLQQKKQELQQKQQELQQKQQQLQEQQQQKQQMSSSSTSSSSRAQNLSLTSASYVCQPTPPSVTSSSSHTPPVTSQSMPHCYSGPRQATLQNSGVNHQQQPIQHMYNMNNLRAILKRPTGQQTYQITVGQLIQAHIPGEHPKQQLVNTQRMTPQMAPVQHLVQQERPAECLLPTQCPAPVQNIRQSQQMVFGQHPSPQQVHRALNVVQPGPQQVHQNLQQSNQQQVHQNLQQSNQQQIHQNLPQSNRQQVHQNLQQSNQQQVHQNLQQSNQQQVHQNLQQSNQQQIHQNLQQSNRQQVHQNLQQSNQQQVHQNLQQSNQQQVYQNLQQSQQQVYQILKQSNQQYRVIQLGLQSRCFSPSSCQPAAMPTQQQPVPYPNRLHAPVPTQQPAGHCEATLKPTFPSLDGRNHQTQPRASDMENSIMWSTQEQSRSGVQEVKQVAPVARTSSRDSGISTPEPVQYEDTQNRQPVDHCITIE